jgi:cob(I)alamin adenosyltransferase
MSDIPNSADTPEEHQERMAKTKAVRDAEVRSKTIRRGVIVVHTGDGKGKSTAGFGVVLRAAGHGQKVAIVQFIKGTWKTGEGNLLGTLPGVTHVVSGNGFTWNTQDKAQDIAASQAGWTRARAFIEAGEHDVVVLDELNLSLSYGYLDISEVATVLRNKPEHMSIVLTGRRAPDEIIEVADTVTEHTLVKHAYASGIRARKGVEF